VSEDEAVARSLLADGGLSQARLETVTTGESGATVFRTIAPGRTPLYVKIARDTAAAALKEEAARTSWLAARGMAVPHIVRIGDYGSAFALLMEAVSGTPADVSAPPVAQLTNALGKALAALHAMPVHDCPFDESLATRLHRAAKTVAAGEIDGADFEPHNRGTPPETLLARLTAERPVEDIVVVHGDATLSNLMIDAEGHVGFIDCGNAGRGDRYLDLAVLAGDIADHHGADAARRFVAAYGVRDWDAAKARYYLDLYELF
jgi:aminoglycoside 3'-phosphotransferase-2